MWSPWAITLSILFIYGVETAPLSACPKSCTCTGTDFYCTSFNFIPLLMDDEASAVTKLVVSNNYTVRNIPKLNHLHNLQTLSITSCKIKQINSLQFPTSVEYLDLSDNFLTTLPHDLHAKLPKLKELHLTGNPISCTCDSITVRDLLLRNKVLIATPVKCHSPKNLNGKSWLKVSCTDFFGEMQGDAPYEGSGFDEIVTESDIEGKNQDKSVEEEFIRVESANKRSKPSKSEMADEEGSGNSDNITPVTEISNDDKNYDDNDEEISVTEPPIPVVRVNDLLLNNFKACNFDCSTPAPLENETDALPPPSVFEGVKIVLDDFGILKGTNITTSTTTTEMPVSITHHETNKNISDDAEILIKQTLEEEKENLIEETKQSNSSTYIFLGALLLLIIALVMYAIVKKRASKRHTRNSNKATEKDATENEVQLLKATKSSNGTHEIIPLMNGHGDSETKPYEDVELRQKSSESEKEDSNLLEPETKRVTIKASEIPNSTPKTPILVTRHLNSDGNIITTPTVHQKV